MSGISLFDYQLNAVRRMKNGCILCGGVGSGKSRTSLAYYYIKNGGEVNTEEYVRMTDPPKDIYIITTARKRDTFEWESELGVFLLSTHEDINTYGNKVVVDSWNNIEKYKDISGSFFIFDEQRLVGNGVWVKTFLKIAKVNEWILLSATPGDTWSDYIPVFLANGFFRTRTEFYDNHVVWSRFVQYPKIDRYLDTGRLVRLRDSILVNMEFNRKTISTHIGIFCDYDKAGYKDIVRNRWNHIENRPIKTANEFCQLLRRLVNTDTSRIENLLEVILEHPRAIVFYNYDYELDLLRNEDIYPEGTEIAEWNGHKHQPIPDSDKWVYLVQYNAGCEGWNCIKTDTVIFFSENYSYRIMTQASGRIDRLNTPFTELFYYHFKSLSPIDSAISAALKKKKEFNEGKFWREISGHF